MRVSRRPEPLRTPAQLSRIDYFRLATLLGFGQLVPDIRLDSPGARLPHFLGGGLLAVVSLSPASPGGFVQLVPDVVLRPTGLLNVARCLGALLGRVGCVGAAVLDGGRTLEAVVEVDLVLEFGGDLPIVIESRSVLERLLVCCDLDELPRVVYPRYMERDQGSTGPQEAHLHAYVLWGIVLVYEQVVYVADLLIMLIVDCVACVLVLYGSETVAALFHACLPRRIFVTYISIPTRLLGLQTCPRSASWDPLGSVFAKPSLANLRRTPLRRSSEKK